MGEREARDLHHNDHEPKHRNQPLHTFAKGKHFLLEAEDVQIDNVNRNQLGARRGQPAARGGARNTSPSCVPDLARRSDKIAEAMVVPSLNARRGNHDSIITTVVHVANFDSATPMHVHQDRACISGSHARRYETSLTQVQRDVTDNPLEHSDHTSSGHLYAHESAGSKSRSIQPCAVVCIKSQTGPTRLIH